jgi:hypothetical protein
MDVKKCACGCGKVIGDATNAQKFYNAKHRRRYYYEKERGIIKPATAKVKKRGTSPEERWRDMSWEKLTATLAQMHKTYGEVQSMRYNGMLPEDFGSDKRG